MLTIPTSFYIFNSLHVGLVIQLPVHLFNHLIVMVHGDDKFTRHNGGALFSGGAPFS